MSKATRQRSFLGPKGLLLLLLILLIAGCPRPLTPVGPPADQPVAALGNGISGRVEMSAFRSSAATIGEIAEGATIALIEANTGHTVAATVSDASGGFNLVFSNGFRPKADQVYYLEALKGLKAGSLPNRVGSPIARVRTMVSFRLGGWVSLNSLVGGREIKITQVTTALSIIASLRAGAGFPIDLDLLIGSLIDATDAGTFTKHAATGITPSGLTQATQLVADTLALDQDPIRSVMLDVASGDFNSFSVAKNPVTISFFSPPSAAIGEPIEIVGENFDPDKARNRVTFTGSGGSRIEAPVQEVSEDRTRLKVYIPVGTTNGPVSAQVGTLMITSPKDFMLASRSGHNVVDFQGNLYVSNYTFGTISKVTPQGITLPLVTGLTNPRSLTLGPDNFLYVANGDGKIVRIDPANPAQANWQTYATGAVGAWGLAFSPSGVLHVSLEGTHQIGKVVAGAIQPVTATGLNLPRGISFGPDPADPSRYVLFVANYGNDTVAKVDPATGATSTYKSGFSRPWSVAFDTFGVMYVSNNAGNSIYRVDADGTVRSFASVQSPGGLSAAPSGYLYVADNTSNRIYQIDTAGYTSVLAEGVSYPKGLVAETDGTFYVANSQNHTVIRIKPDGSVSTIARGFFDPAGLALDEANKVLYVGNYGNGTVSRVSLLDGSVSTILRNLYPVSGIAYRKNALNEGLLYVFQHVSKEGATVFDNVAEVLEYDVTNPAITPPLRRAIRNPLRRNLGIARDPRAVGTVYVTQPEENYLAAVNPATGAMRRFVATAPVPYDVAVDAGGFVYVACRGTDDTNDAIQVFSDAGVLVDTLTDPVHVDRPLAMAYDAATGDVFFGNGSTGAVNTGSIKRIKTSDRTISAVVAGSPLTNPIGIAFTGTTMLVANNNNVHKVEAYATAPAISLAFARSGVQDVETDPAGNVYTITGSIIKSTITGANAVVIGVNVLGGTRRLGPRDANGFYVTGYTGSVYVHQNGGGTPLMWQGMASTFNNSTIQGPMTPAIAVGSHDGKDWLFTPSAGTWVSGIMKINLDPNASEFYQASYGGDSDGPRGLAFDPVTKKAWALSGIRASGVRFNPNHTAVEASMPRDGSYIGYGATFWGGAFYGAIYSHHRIDRFDAGTLAVTPLSSGFGGPEL